MSNYKDLKHKNLVDTGTIGTKVATGTTAQRGSATGEWRYNSTTGFFEGRNTSGSFTTLEPSPTVTSVGLTNILESQISGNYDLAITGTNFASGATVKFIGNDATEYSSPTVTVNSTTSITARVNTSISNANEPFDVQVISASGLSGSLADAFNVNASPVWVTTSGNISSVFEGAGVSSTLSATDPEGDTVTYGIQTGSLPSGVSLNTSSGAITGTAPSVGADTTSSFTIRATSSVSNITDRAFNIIVKDEGILGSAEFYIDPSDSRSWSGSGSTLTNITTNGSKSANTTNLSLNSNTVATNSGITYIDMQLANGATTATLGNISGNHTNYTFAMFTKLSDANSGTNAGQFFYGSKLSNQAIGGNVTSASNDTNNTFQHYNYSNDSGFPKGSIVQGDWNFYVYRTVSSTKQLWINNSQLSATSAVNNSLSLPANSTFDYGGRNAPNAYNSYDWHLGFCGVWSTAISDSDIAFLWNGFKGNYGL
jgi:hypothetical protein